MSQTYKFKSLQISKNEEEQEASKEEQLTVFTLGESKTIDFNLKDGTRQNFNYSHFITSWLGNEDNLNVIKIFFSTHLVTIKGYCLEELHEQLIEKRVKSIIENDIRYQSMVDKGKCFVIELNIFWKKEYREKV